MSLEQKLKLAQERRDFLAVRAILAIMSDKKKSEKKGKK